MKTIKRRNYEQLTLIFLTSIFFFSCSGSNLDAISSGKEVINSVELRTNKGEDLVYIGEEIESSVIVNEHNILSTDADFYVDNEKISGYKFTPTLEKEYVVKAVYKGIESDNRIKIHSEKKGEVFQKNVLIETYTSTWCGWCPRVSYAIEELNKQSKNTVAISVHNYDLFQNEFTKKIKDFFEINERPKALLDRKDQWSFPEPKNIEQILKLTENKVPIGIKLASSVNDTEMKVSVTVKFGNSLKKQLKLTVFAIEDGIESKQMNFTKFYGGPRKINDFIHNEVLRYCFTNVLGDEIPSVSTVKGGTFAKVFKAKIPKYIVDKTKLSFVAFVSYADDNSSINVRKIKANQTNDFQIK